MSDRRRERILIYGANGDTGRRLAAQALRLGLDTVLGGRNRDQVARLASETGAAFGIAEVNDREGLDRLVGTAGVVLNAAGPMSETAAPLISAAIRTGSHYLDVTGEMDVFIHAHRQDELARQAGVMVMPGVGYGIVASDCLAAAVATRCPEAVFLRIALTVPKRLSPGSVQTALSMSQRQVVVRRHGELIRRGVGRLERRYDFGNGETISSAITWPDVFTAFLSTGIPNCEVYAEANWMERWTYQIGSWAAPFLRSSRVKDLVLAVAERAPRKDDGEQIIIAETEDPWRRKTLLRLATLGGYDFTAFSAIEVARRVVSGQYATGFHTPSQVYGSDLVLSVPGSRLLS